MRVYERLLEGVSALPVLDTHEHLPVRPELRLQPCDLFTEFLSHYFDKDLLSAGMPKQDLLQALDMNLPVLKRWALLAPWWEACRTTGYGRSLDLAAQGVYGFDRIDGETIEPLYAAFAAQSHNPGHFRHVLKDLCHITRSVNDGFVHETGRAWSDDSLFFQVKRLDQYLDPSLDGLAALAQRTGAEATGLDSYLYAVEQDLLCAPDNGYAGFKLGVAYWRPLKFDKCQRKDAEALFQDSLARAGQNQTPAFARPLQDYVLHHALSTLDKMGAFLQIHTGFQEGNGNTVAHSDPLLLNDLFAQYPNLQFDLFHIGYPFSGHAGILAKMYPNVSLDFCWMNIISPAHASQMLYEFLDSVPRNKIFAFGGDYLFVDGVYGHQLLARRAVARALSRKVEEDVMDQEEALRTAKMLLHDNAINRLGLRL